MNDEKLFGTLAGSVQREGDIVSPIDSPITVYFDTEFTDLVAIECDLKLISAGLVAPDGREFYFELTDNYRVEECSSFVLEGVLPHLNADKHGMTCAQAAATLSAWLEAFGEPVRLATDAPGYDWPLISTLFEDHNCWPATLERKASNVSVGNVQQEIENYFACQPMSVRHHALWDARALAYAARIENEYWAGRE